MAVFTMDLEGVLVSYCAGGDVYTTSGFICRGCGVAVGFYQFRDYGGKHALLCRNGAVHLKISLISAKACESAN